MTDGNARGMAARWVGLALLITALAGCEPPEPPEVERAAEGLPSPADDPIETLATYDQRLERHMELMAAVPEDSLLHVMPMHFEEVGAMLDEMEPMSLGIQSDTVWRSTLDSVQTDLARMRDMGSEELGHFMPDHIRRVERLIFLHDSVMGMEH